MWSRVEDTHCGRASLRAICYFASKSICLSHTLNQLKPVIFAITVRFRTRLSIVRTLYDVI